MSDIFCLLTEADWWDAVADKFFSVLGQHKQDRICLLYNADADGFTAGYFVLGIIDSLTRPQPANIQIRAVWNYEYDFSWLPEYAACNNPDVVICVDIPIIQEAEILQKISNSCEILIYDHHVPPERLDPIPHVFYANSHLLEARDVDYPASFFSAALAFEAHAVAVVDMPVLACGLFGDNCLYTNKQMTGFLLREFPAFLQTPSGSRPPLSRLTSRLNALFRANPGFTPADAQRDLYMLLRSRPADEAFAKFCVRYKLNKAQQLITQEVQPALEFLRAVAPSRGVLLCHVLDFTTFSAGIAASVLAAESRAPVIALGFQVAGRVQFELRTSRDNKIDLTELLKFQRRFFTPISSGGHPKAAGALVYTADVAKFQNSLQKSLLQILPVAMRQRGE